MRLSIVAIVVCTAGSAWAAPASRCFAGTSVREEHGHKDTMAIVIAIDADPTAKQVRERDWSEDEPVDRTRDYKVDPAARTIESDFHRTRITGTFEGDPWAWTAYHTKTQVMQETMATDAKIAGDTLVIDSHADGPLPSKRHVDAKAFDCKQLDAKVAALDALPAGAQRFCFDGHDTGGRHDEHVVIEQIVEAKRLRVRRWGTHRMQSRTFAKDGTKLTLEGTGIGSIAGKPGAWTGYKWASTDPAFQLATDSTLGGATLTETLTGKARDGVDRTRTVHGTAFDCKDLPHRRDAIRSEAPSRDHEHHGD